MKKEHLVKTLNGMDYEKKYKEALARAREIHISKDEMEYLFPELKESDDERIKKSLIVLLRHFCEGYRPKDLEFYASYKDYKEMLDWVKKQINTVG